MKDGYLMDGYADYVETLVVREKRKLSRPVVTVTSFESSEADYQKSIDMVESSPRMPKNKHTRININLPTELVEYLKEQSEESYVTMTGQIVDAITLVKMIRSWTKDGKRLLIKSPDGTTQEMILFI